MPQTKTIKLRFHPDCAAFAQQHVDMLAGKSEFQLEPDSNCPDRDEVGDRLYYINDDGQPYATVGPPN